MKNGYDRSLRQKDSDLTATMLESKVFFQDIQMVANDQGGTRSLASRQKMYDTIRSLCVPTREGGTGRPPINDEISNIKRS